jgi:hypothetical protein
MLVLPYDKRTRKTVPCPFCGHQHHHGVGDHPEIWKPGKKMPHRIGHCPDKNKRDEVIAPDGTVLYQDDGYFLKVFDSSEQVPAGNTQLSHNLCAPSSMCI